ncbi:MAG: radical SAM protein [Elusimicrobiota bacterium]
MKKVILFQPAIGYMDEMRTMPSLPLGLLSAVSLVNKSYDVVIIDQRTEKNWQAAVDRISDADIVCAGVTALTGAMIKGGVEFSKYIKEKYEIPVVWGGVHASLLPRQTLENRYIDIVVQGEGEITFLKVVEALDTGKSLSGVSGIWHKQNGSPEKTADREFVQIEELPEMPYHLVDVNKYLPVYKGRKSVYFQSSRGCPYSCNYCYNTVFNRGRWRAVPAQKTLASLRKLVKENSDIEDVYFVDDNFFIDMKRAEDIIKGMNEIGVSWQVQGVDIMALKNMDDAFFSLMEKNGCRRLTVGIESGSERIRKMMSKQGTVQDIMEVMERLKNRNIVIVCSFLAAVPGEEYSDVKATVGLVFDMQKINPLVRCQPVYLYTPYPGTGMYEEALKTGYKPPVSIEEWALCEWDTTIRTDNRKFYESLHFVSLFVDRKTEEYGVPRIVRFLAGLYRPVARARLRNLCFVFMAEKWIYRIASRLWLGSGVK